MTALYTNNPESKTFEGTLLSHGFVTKHAPLFSDNSSKFGNQIVPKKGLQNQFFANKILISGAEGGTPNQEISCCISLFIFCSKTQTIRCTDQSSRVDH